MISERISDDIPPYIRRYTSPNENFEYGYPHSNTLLQSCLASHTKAYDEYFRFRRSA